MEGSSDAAPRAVNIDIGHSLESGAFTSQTAVVSTASFVVWTNNSMEVQHITIDGEVDDRRPIGPGTADSFEYDETETNCNFCGSA